VAVTGSIGDSLNIHWLVPRAIKEESP